MHQAISHQTTSFITNKVLTQQLVKETISQLEKKENLFLPLAQTLELLHELASFNLGRFLLHNRGLNGYWTSYIFRNNANPKTLCNLESWLLNESFYVMARERFYVFQAEISKKLKANMTLASIPCGLMDELLFLDYSAYNNIKLVGIDADQESLDLARLNADEQGFSKDQVQFIQKDAWNLNMKDEFDLLTSNGLNMYEACEERLIALYQSFYQALKPNGTLIISFIPPAPEHINSIISTEQFLKERSLFSDIVPINYLNFCTEEQMKRQLLLAGFTVEKIVYNAVEMAPVVIARK